MDMFIINCWSKFHYQSLLSNIYLWPYAFEQKVPKNKCPYVTIMKHSILHPPLFGTILKTKFFGTMILFCPVHVLGKMKHFNSKSNWRNCDGLQKILIQLWACCSFIDNKYHGWKKISPRNSNNSHFQCKSLFFLFLTTLFFMPWD
jgi:hypothetical protein